MGEENSLQRLYRKWGKTRKTRWGKQPRRLRPGDYSSAAYGVNSPLERRANAGAGQRRSPGRSRRHRQSRLEMRLGARNQRNRHVRGSLPVMFEPCCGIDTYCLVVIIQTYTSRHRQGGWIKNPQYGVGLERSGATRAPCRRAATTGWRKYDEAQNGWVDRPFSGGSLDNVSTGAGGAFLPEIQVPEDHRSWSYTLSNSAGGLRINGVATAPIWGSADIPEQFEHTNILAVPVSTASKPAIGRPRRAANGAIQFTVIDGSGGQTNVIEASDDLITWTPISTNVFPATLCPNCPFIDFQDPASTNLARRFYRSFSLP